MKPFLFIFFLASIFQPAYCQGVYFKTSANYNISTINRPIPEYFSHNIPVPVGPDSNSKNINQFSIASGPNIQGTIGYSLNDFLSFELRMSTFKNSKKVFQNTQNSHFTNGVDEWDYDNLSLLPTVLFGQAFNKSTISIFVYSGLGINNLKIKSSFGDIFNEYKLALSKSFSWGYGLEYAYSISNKFSLYTNIGVHSSNFKPIKAELISSYFSLENLTTSQKEIKFVDDIYNLELYYDGSQNPNSPEIQIRETLKLNSIYFGIGIKYRLKK